MEKQICPHCAKNGEILKLTSLFPEYCWNSIDFLMWGCHTCKIFWFGNKKFLEDAMASRVSEYQLKQWSLKDKKENLNKTIRQLYDTDVVLNIEGKPTRYALVKRIKKD